MSGRTTLNNYRIYVDGYDMSGYSRSFGPLACTFDEGTDDAVSLPVKATLPGNATVSMGTLNGIYDNTADVGIHVLMKGAGVKRNVMIAAGIQAPPADNDPVFMGQFEQMGYEAGASENPITATISFSQTSGLAANLNYAKPWGVLLHAPALEDAVNAANGIDQLAQSSLGGYMMYHVFSGDGDAVIKVQDASTNDDAEFADLLSSGTLDCTSPKSGVVALANDATVERYIRWQIELDTATEVTFALGWVRNNI